MMDAKIPALGEFVKAYVPYIRETKENRSWVRSEEILRLHLVPYYGSERKQSDTDTR